jgi:hypothetical protein
MNWVNNSKHAGGVLGGVHSALPCDPTTRVANINQQQQSINLNAGLYYVYVATTNVGTLPPGTLVAQTGGVTNASTVTLDQDDRIVVT